MKPDCYIRYLCRFVQHPQYGHINLFRLGGEGSTLHIQSDINEFLEDCGYRYLWVPDLRKVGETRSLDKSGKLLLTDPFHVSIVRLKFGA